MYTSSKIRDHKKKKKKPAATHNLQTAERRTTLSSPNSSQVTALHLIIPAHIVSLRQPRAPILSFLPASVLPLQQESEFTFRWSRHARLPSNGPRSLSDASGSGGGGGGGSRGGGGGGGGWSGSGGLQVAMDGGFGEREGMSGFAHRVFGIGDQGDGAFETEVAVG